MKKRLNQNFQKLKETNIALVEAVKSIKNAVVVLSQRRLFIIKLLCWTIQMSNLYHIKQ